MGYSAGIVTENMLPHLLTSVFLPLAAYMLLRYFSPIPVLLPVSVLLGWQGLLTVMASSLMLIVIVIGIVPDITLCFSTFL